MTHFSPPFQPELKMSSLDILLNHSAQQSPTDSTDKLAPDILAVSSGYQHVEEYVDECGIQMGRVGQE